MKGQVLTNADVLRKVHNSFARCVYRVLLVISIYVFNSHLLLPYMYGMEIS